ncbi:MAG: aminoglycoside phosphotransferase family protein [Anaerolineae bacterium]|jgi:aminoglycoside phosphotransferase (APT) family kinase protein|nr:aminoglycoside phosphotransferase family protein [Anaerolineae bacterium]
MESKTKNKQTREQIERMANRAFNLGLDSGEDAVIELKQGWFNAVYAVRLANGHEVILKIAPPKDAEVMLYEKNIMRTEVDSMRLVRANPKIPVPEIYFYDDAHDLCDADYFFMEKIYGENLGEIRTSLDEETMSDYDRQIGAIVREINRFKGTYFGFDGNPEQRADTWKEAFFKIVESLLSDAARKNVVFDYSYDEIRTVIQKHASALEEITTPCLVHWDAWPANIFVKDGKVNGIVDFERALWAEPLMEAQFRTLFKHGITDRVRGMGKTSFTPAEEQRNQLYSLHLALVMHVECFYRNYDTDDIFNFSRMYLRKTMEWLQDH